MKIIAVDDEAGSLKLIEKTLRNVCPEEELSVYADPFLAISESRKTPPDIAFLDITMPGMTGLEAAKKLKSVNPKINIIFVTGYAEYASQAFLLHASGYLTKPVTARDIKKELENLRNPIVPEKNDNGVFLKTFGNFDIFVNGKSLGFQRALAKEVLAYLTNRHGSTVTRKELASVLFEDKGYTRSVQSYITQIIKSLKTALDEADVGDILLIEHNSYALDIQKVKCDAYDFLNGDPTAINLFSGEYMSQYSWAEEYITNFYDHTG